METIQILLGVIIAILLSLPLFLYLFLKYAKLAIAKAEKLQDVVEQYFNSTKADHITKLEISTKIFDKVKQIDESLLYTVDKSIQTLDQSIGSKVERFVEVKGANDRVIIESLNQLVELNQKVHKTLLEVVDLEKELSSK